MVLLTLIAVAQLVVSVLILGALGERPTDQRRTAEQTLQAMQQQTIQALLAAEAAARPFEPRGPAPRV